MNRRSYFLLLFLLPYLAACGKQQSASVDASGSAASPPDAPGVATTDVTWVKFQDPLEQAFTIEVPQGWTVKGGMFRLGYSDHRPMVDLTSPDGMANIRMGDVSVPTYFLPNQYHREGTVYDLVAQAQGVAAQYRTGQKFAALYGQSRFKAICSTLTPQQADSPPPFKAPTPQQSGVTITEISDGQVTYECASGPGSKTAYAYTQTVLTGQLWQVPAIVSFLVPPHEIPLARNIVQHCLQSLHLNPEWVRKQNQLDEQALVYQRERQQARVRALSQQAAQFEVRMQSIQNQVSAFERGQAAEAKQFQGFDNALVGITPTTDPLGNERDVFTGPKSGYWTDGLGRTVNSDTSPGPGWQPLTPKQ